MFCISVKVLDSEQTCILKQQTPWPRRVCSSSRCVPTEAAELLMRCEEVLTSCLPAHLPSRWGSASVHRPQGHRAAAAEGARQMCPSLLLHLETDYPLELGWAQQSFTLPSPKSLICTSLSKPWYFFYLNPVGQSRLVLIENERQGMSHGPCAGSVLGPAGTPTLRYPTPLLSQNWRPLPAPFPKYFPCVHQGH